MPRPNVPPPKDVIAIAKGLKAEGIAFGAIKCAEESARRDDALSLERE